MGLNESPAISELSIDTLFTKFIITLTVSLLLYGCDRTVSGSRVKYTEAAQDSQATPGNESITKSVFHDRPSTQPRNSVVRRARQTWATDSVTKTQESQLPYAKTRAGEHEFRPQSRFGEVGEKARQSNQKDYRFRPQNTAKRYQPYLPPLSLAPYDYQGLTTGEKVRGLNKDDDDVQGHMEYVFRLPDSGR